jgi:hypothetical protein
MTSMSGVHEARASDDKSHLGVYNDSPSLDHGIETISYSFVWLACPTLENRRSLQRQLSMSSITKIPDRHMIHVTLYFAPENVPIALKACNALFEDAWKEPQLDFCQIVQNADEPGIIRIQEAWNTSRKYLDEVTNHSFSKAHRSLSCSL